MRRPRSERPRSDPRALAHEVLLRVETTRAFADVLLGARLREMDLGASDQALATRLVFGTLAWQRLLDSYLAHLSDRPLVRLDSPVRIALRLGLFQLLFLDRVPAYAAVDGTVGLVPIRARGFVNAVLRRAARLGREGFPVVATGATTAHRLAIEWSHPTWLVERWLAELGEEETRALLAANAEPAPTTIRVNRARTTPEALQALLASAGIESLRGRWAADALVVVSGGGRLRDTGAWRTGLFAFQSEASQLVAGLVAPPPGGTVVDACAAPGGKITLLASQVGDEGFVVGLDPRLGGARRVAAEAERLGTDAVRVVVGDARRPPLSTTVDAVLVDAPCTGLGTLRRHPELRWRVRPQDTDRLAGLQREILLGAAPLVRPGGVLVYAVCTISREETDGVVRAFLATEPRFEAESAAGFVPPALVDPSGFLRTMPHRHGLDGFFAARLRARR